MPLVLTDITPVEGGQAYATLTLNNPDERNTLTAPMVAEIIAAMDAIEGDERVAALVVTGTAPAFCAGANLGNLAESTEESLGGIYEGFLRIARSSLPTIAAVNGAAIEFEHVPLHETTDDDFERMMGVNVTALFRCMRAQLGAMLAQRRRTGRIVGEVVDPATDLVGEQRQHEGGHCFTRQQRTPRMTQVAELHGIAEPVRSAPTTRYLREVIGAESEEPLDRRAVRRRIEDHSALRRR